MGRSVRIPAEQAEDRVKYESQTLQVIINAKRQLEQYQFMRACPERAWEIRLYDWILNHPQGEQMAKRYLDTRFPLNAEPIPKRTLVRMLGWLVP